MVFTWHLQLLLGEKGVIGDGFLGFYQIWVA